VNVLKKVGDLKLLYKVLNKGEGKESPKAATTCKVHYRGTLRTGKQFDSSYDRGDPTEFAPNQVIKGWTIALQEMVEGDKWELYIPSDLAYGESGAGKDIPGGEPLQFIIELIKIEGKDRLSRIVCKAWEEGQPDCTEDEKKYADQFTHFINHARNSGDEMCEEHGLKKLKADLATFKKMMGQETLKADQRKQRNAELAMYRLAIKTVKTYGAEGGKAEGDKAEGKKAEL